MNTFSKFATGLICVGTAAFSVTSNAYTITAAARTPAYTNSTSATDYWTAIEYRTQTGGNGGVVGAFDAWCVEEMVHDSPSPWTYDVTNLVGGTHYTAAVQQAVERLWWVADAATGAPTYSTQTTPLDVNATLYAAAFQIALWELVTDGINWDLSSGTIFLGTATSNQAFTEQVRTLAGSWLGQVVSANYVGGQTALEYLDTLVGQDHIRPKDPGTGGDDPVPAPGVALLLLAGIAAGSRLRARK